MVQAEGYRKLGKGKNGLAGASLGGQTLCPIIYDVLPKLGASRSVLPSKQVVLLSSSLDKTWLLSCS